MDHRESPDEPTVSLLGWRIPRDLLRCSRAPRQFHRSDSPALLKGWQSYQCLSLRLSAYM